MAASRLLSSRLLLLSQRQRPRSYAIFDTIFSSTRNESSGPDPRAPSLTLYQYAICPFCNQAKALIAYCGIQYDFVEVNPLTKSELKSLPIEYRKVPIAIIDDEQINGSDEIVSALLKHPFIQSTLDSRWKVMNIQRFQESESARKWTSFAKEDLAGLLYPNICRTISDSYQAFGYVKDVSSFSPIQKVTIQSLGSLAMYFAASKVKAKRGIKDERGALDDALHLFENDALTSGNKFASGTDEPDLGDIVMFGTIRSVEGLPAHNRAILERGGPVSDWYIRMKDEVYNE